VHAYPPGHARRSILVDFLGNLSDRLIVGGFVTRNALESLQQAIAAHVADPETLVVFGLYFQAWGRKV
jgi:hypothetical protein